MRVFQHETFRGFTDFDSGATFSDLEFYDCEFHGSTISVAHSPRLRSTVRNVRLIGCSQLGCSIESAICEDVLVDGLKTNGQLVMTFGAAFKHVVLRGRIESLLITNRLFGGFGTTEERQAFFDANAQYYRNVDWALDISQAEFKDFEIRGVPARLVRRDPETEGIVTREKALGGSWRTLSFKSKVTPTCLDLFLERQDPDYVFVAPKRDACFRDYLADLRLLRKAGIVEPD
jgi:hypothetical protein